ncbi:MAG TPA: IS1634 family transposase [Streptosporangiaceae bacterium]|nr:IS1634 family transposase [Streptosporangiaceae bacterium]
MYLRSTPRRNKDGSEVRYLQLAHNVWDPQKRRSTVQVVYNFGREDAANREALQRLAASVMRFLDPDAALAAAAEGLEFTESRPLGGTWALDALWSRLGIGEEMRRLLKGRRLEDTAERVLFALVANRALAPSSKLAAARWASEDVMITGLPVAGDDACYRAMDWLLEIKDDLERKVFDNLANLLNLEVDLLFFDTTSTYFVTEEEDEPVARDKNGNLLTSENTDGDAGGQREPAGFRTWGKSKDHRDDLPQVVIGMAVTRDGIPVRVWCWPGNTSDSALIRQVKDDMRDWCLSKVIWVADRGFTSAENRRYLRKGGGSYIIGEKLRSGSAEAAAALSRQGRYKDVAGNLKVKEVRIAEDERFVICFNPGAAERDATVRARMIAQLEEAIAGSDQLSAGKRGELRGVISTKPGLNRYLRVTPGGLLRIDASKAKAEENLDGKYLLRTADPKLSAEDIALGYKQLLEVERGWRDMKQVIDLRPVYHRREDRIRAHVILCWLALLLARISENACGQTWPELRRELDRIHVGTFTGPAGTFRQRTEITKPQAAILKALQISAPPRIYQLKPAMEE